MRRSKEAKQQTHERIVAAAARRFRTEGISGVGIADLMGEAGLTHGGFYAHFGNKDALVAEACGVGLAQSRDRLIHHVRKAPAEQQLAQYIDLYLSAYHRDHPETGCAMPSMGGELARSAPKVRAAFTQAFSEYRDKLATLFPDVSATGDGDTATTSATGDGDTATTDEAMVLLAGLAGAMLLARAVDDPDLSERILSVNREFYKRAFPSHVTADEQPQQ